MIDSVRQLAVVTGASSGIGFELAEIAAEHGYDLIVAADEPEVENAARRLRERGGSVDAVQTDLATFEGVDALLAAIQRTGRSVDCLFANAGRGLGKGFLDQDVRSGVG
jgi:short-subunit dehydrogenase